MRVVIHKAQKQPKRVVFPEGEEEKILRACQILVDERIADPILLGDKAKILERAEECRLHLEDSVQVVNPRTSRIEGDLCRGLYRLRQRKGVTQKEAEEYILNRNVFGSMMVRMAMPTR